MKKIIRLTICYFLLVIGTSAWCFAQDIKSNEETLAGWRHFDIEEPETHATISNKPIFCGKQKAVIPLKSSMRIVDLKHQQSIYIPVKKAFWVASCSEDGRYIFISGVEKFGGEYGLSYFDLNTGKEYQVFSSLDGRRHVHITQLVSPNADYLIGPDNIGPTVTLSGGKVLTVIPISTIKEIDSHCDITWSIDGSKLFYVLQSNPKKIDGINKLKVTYRYFDMSTRAWSDVSTDYLNVESIEVACPTAFLYRDQFFYKSESMRYAPTGQNDVFEFAHDGAKLNIKKSWLDISDFTLGRDGTIAYSHILGIKYFYDGYELTAGGDIEFEVLFEDGSHLSYFTKAKILKVKDIPEIKFAIGKMAIGVAIDSFEGPVAVVNEFQPRFMYKAAFFEQIAH